MAQRYKLITFYLMTHYLIGAYIIWLEVSLHLLDDELGKISHLMQISMEDAKDV
jgi:hypothetical protein